MRGPHKFFQAIEFVRVNRPPLATYPDGHCDFSCPNKTPHSTNRAFTVRNAKPDGSGFWMFCHHTGCQDENGHCDRAKMLDIECQNRGITHARELLPWCPGYVDDDYLPEAFVRHHGAIWQVTEAKDDEEAAKQTYVCNDIRFIAVARNQHGEGWGTLIRINQVDGRTRELFCEKAWLATGGEKLREELLDLGVTLPR